MRLTIKATGITLTDEIRDYLSKKLQTLDKYIDLEDSAVLTAVELGRSTKHHQNGDIFYAEINIYRGKEAWRSVANEVTLTAAIDSMQGEIARAVTEGKGKKLSLTRRGGLAAKEFMRYGYEGLEYMGKPARMGLKYFRRLWRRDRS